MGFALSVADAVRAAGGPGQAVVFRMSGASLVDGGSSADEVIRLRACWRPAARSMP